MNKFIYIQVTDAAVIPTEMVINPLQQIDSVYMPVRLRFHFTASEQLIDTQVIEVPFVNQRACDLVGACLLFSPLAEQASLCQFPYLKDGAVWVELAVELTKVPLSSGDLLNLYASHFNATPSAAILRNLHISE